MVLIAIANGVPGRAWYSRHLLESAAQQLSTGIAQVLVGTCIGTRLRFALHTLPRQPEP